ncbi:MAG TPA: energy transducer TonB, partial [Thermoanaerobaculia bacterium]|nr:energy transducer TonB [Thermoanaerobaculia bacterium]
MNSKPLRTAKIWIWSAVPAALLAGALGAAEPLPPKGPLDHLSAEVRTPLLQADGHLRRQEWEQARGLLQGLLADAGRDHSWKGSYRETLWRLAVAEAGLGRADDAQWRWQAVQGFGTPPPAQELAPYGAAAEQLARTAVRQPGAAPAGLEVDRGPGLAAPRRVQGEALDLQQLQQGAPPLWARVELVVDAEGRVRAPAVVDTTSTALSYRVLEAVRGWRYEPARRDGKPVATLLTVNVNSPREQPLGEIAPPAGPLAEIDRLLLAGSWGEARRRGDVLWTQALHNAQQTRPAFALLLTQRALA